MGDGFESSSRPTYLLDADKNIINPATEEKQDAIIVAIGGTSDATTVTEYNITLTSADTEYSQALPANTLAYAFKNRDYNELRWSFTTGKVATPTAPYNQLKAGITHWKEDVDLSSKTLYFASATAGDIVELIVFS